MIVELRKEFGESFHCWVGERNCLLFTWEEQKEQAPKLLAFRPVLAVIQVKTGV